MGKSISYAQLTSKDLDRHFQFLGGLKNFGVGDAYLNPSVRESHPKTPGQESLVRLDNLL
jgi:hypothetical protein